MSIRGLAEKIAESLFVNGAGERAQRLVLELPDGRNGGGWAHEPAIDRIERALVEAVGAQPQRANSPASTSAPVSTRLAGRKGQERAARQCTGAKETGGQTC